MGSKSKQPAARLGDIASNHGPWPPTPIIAGAGSVTINGIPAARKGDAVLLHAIPNNPPHARSIAEGSGSVLIEGKPAARVSDAISCGGKVATGSGDVLIGDSPKLLKPAAVNIPDLNIPDIVFAKQTGSIAKSKTVTPTQTTALQADDAVIYTPPPAAPADTIEATDTLSTNKQSAVDYWSQQKDSADNFPEYLAAHLMGLNAETGYSIAEGLQATYEIVTDKDKFLATMDAVKDSVVDTVTDPIGTYNSIKQAAVAFSELPLSEQGEAAYRGILGLLAGGGAGKAAGALGKLGKTPSKPALDGLHNQDMDVQVERGSFKTVRQVDMDKLSDMDAIAYDQMKEQGWDNKKIAEVLSSGEKFNTKELLVGDKLYGFDTDGRAKDVSTSAYWVDEESFLKIKQQHQLDGEWDKEGVKNTLALPCYNRANSISVVEVTENTTAVQSKVGKATELIKYSDNTGYETGVLGKIMPGGGTQTTVNPSVLKLLGN